MLDGNGVKDAAAQSDPQGLGQWTVDVDFNGQGSGGWKQLVSDACANTAAGNRVAIVLDDKVISSPGVVPALCSSGGGGSTSITGDFSQSEAKDLAVLIKGGALPVPVEVIEQRTVGATLGDVAIKASIEAAIIGIILTGLFIMFVYRLVGLLATIALGTYALISYGLLVWLGATLTLPGLAGFVLAIGLAIDANVLVFERAREEYAERTAGGLSPALNTGFNKAWSAIIDSNVTTLLAAGAAVLLRVRAGQGLRRHAVDRRHRLDGLGTGRGPRAHRVGDAPGVRPQASCAQRHQRNRSDPQVADRERA